jgi:hypothetical protein
VHSAPRQDGQGEEAKRAEGEDGVISDYGRPSRHNPHPGNTMPTAIAIDRLAKSRGFVVDRYEAVHGRDKTWVCETSKGRRWVTCRLGKWATSMEEPT